jgi:heme-degrading monooxygenase HmoA
MTITRLWHGTTHVKDADAYLAYLTQTGLPDYRATKGNRSARILRRIEGQICHFITISEWEDYESIQQFAGEEYEKARYYDEDKKYLIDLEEKVMHYETHT